MRRNLLYLILLPLGLTISFSPGLTVLNLASLASIFLAILTKKKLLVVLSLAVLLAQVLVFVAVKGTPIRQELARDPGEMYSTDMRAFLKTYYLMKSGVNFYEAFPKGMSGWIGPNFKTDLGGWREPLPFWLWTSLPGNGESIYYLGLAMILSILLAGYAIARKFLSAEKSLIVPYLLLPYFFLPLSDLTLLQVEWWGLSFFIVGLAFFLHDRPFFAGVFFALSLATREIFLIPVASMIICTLIFKRNKSLLPVFIPLIIFGVFFLFYHLPRLSLAHTTLLRTTQLGDWHLLNVTFAYSSWNYLLGTWRPFVVLFVATTTMLFIQFLKRKWQPALLLAAVYLPMFIFAFLVSLGGGLTVWHDYWGIYFVPLLIIVSPIVLATFLPTRFQE